MTNNYYNPFEGHEQEMYEDWLAARWKEFKAMDEDVRIGQEYFSHTPWTLTFEEYLEEYTH